MRHSDGFMGAALRPHHRQQGMVLITVYMIVWVLTSLLTLTAMRGLNELQLVGLQHDSTQAFYLAEAGIQRALWQLSQSPVGTSNDDIAGAVNANSQLGNDNDRFTVTIATPDPNDPTLRTISSTGTVGSIPRTIQVQARFGSWVDRVPGALYGDRNIELTFHKREEPDQEPPDETTDEEPSADPYIDGGPIPGIYSTGGVIQKHGRGRISGTPPILENQPVPEGLRDGVWEAFDLNALREVSKANGTYVAADRDPDPTNPEDFNNLYNKNGKYTLPLEGGRTESVFFFDTKSGLPLDDDEVSPKNEVRVKLSGTCRPISHIPIPISGVIVVVGDLEIRDTTDCDFLFNGLIIALDDVKITDQRHHRRDPMDTNSSDIVIRGAVLSNNVIEKGKPRKKKPAVKIKNATIQYDALAIATAQKDAFPGSHWGIVPGTWRELAPPQ